MKKRLLGLALLTLGMSFVARDARAVEGDGPSLVSLSAATGVVVLDLGLATTDLVIGAHGKWGPRVYGGFETAAAGAQLAYVLDKELASSNAGAWEFGAAFVAILTAHGLVTLLAPRSPGEAPPPPAPVTVAPLALSDVSRASVPGLAVLGRF